MTITTQLSLESLSPAFPSAPPPTSCTTRDRVKLDRLSCVVLHTTLTDTIRCTTHARLDSYHGTMQAYRFIID